MEVASAGIVVEGHLKWLHELAPLIQKSAKSQNETLESYCAKLLRVSECGNAYGSAEEDEDEDDQDQQVGVSWKDKVTLISRRFNTVAMNILIKDKVKARLLLGQLDSLFNQIFDTEDSLQHKLMLHCSKVLKCQLEEKDDGKTLNRMWEELTVGKDEGQATAYFLQGMLGFDMKIDGDKIAQLFLQAAGLDPTCLVWCHHAYRSIRRNRGKGSNQGGPSDKERTLLERAYQGCDGKNAIIALDYGLLLKEKFWVRKRKRDEEYWRVNHALYLQCVQALENAERISKGPWKMKSKLYLAEFLYFGKAPEEDKKRGREMLLELEREFPNSLSVLHKLGNLYRTEEDFSKARQCYQRALQRKPNVMPCIMDFCKLLKRQGDRTEMVKILEKALSPDYIRSDRDQEILQMERDRIQPNRNIRNLTAADMDNNWRQ